MPKKNARGPVQTAMGRLVIRHSAPKHPEQSDPLAPPLQLLSRLDIADFSRNRPTPERDKTLRGEPRMEFTEGGPVRNAGGSESYNTSVEKRGGRLASQGKRGFKRNEYGSGGVS